MYKYLALALLGATLLFTCETPSTTETSTADAAESATETTERPPYALVIHGGAGTIRKENMTPEREEAIRAAMNAALDRGEEMLREGGSALDAVEQTIHLLEDSPYFNAGRGAVFTHDEKNEHDASIMDGRDRSAGAVGGVSIIRHPISLARAVMEHSPHVMLTGTGAETFAREQGLEIVDPEYFFTQERFDALQRAKAAEAERTSSVWANPDYKFGTVGCVALDNEGNIAAGTSTGGMTNKRWNRIGDAPIIGAGTYANNATCGVSCTGHGEYFIRYAVAYDVSAQMEYGGKSLQEAGDAIIHDKLVAAGGEGGLIALDKNGNIIMPFNSEGMYRGYAKPGERQVLFYEAE
jgi:beta-aspartyl-peptidase (threonine type)